MKAKDVMTTEVLTVAPGTTVEEIAKLMLEHRISGVPVADEQGAVLGIVSESDLMRRPEIGTDQVRRTRSWFSLLFEGPDEPVKRYMHSHGHRAREIMSDHVIAVDEETPLSDIVQQLEQHHIKRVPVLRDGRLVGLISRANLVQALSAVARHAPEPPADDRALREQITTALSEAGVRASFINVTVLEGQVEVWGTMDSEAQREAARLAIEETVPAGRVNFHLSLLPPRVRSYMGGA